MTTCPDSAVAERGRHCALTRASDSTRRGYEFLTVLLQLMLAYAGGRFSASCLASDLSPRAPTELRVGSPNLDAFLYSVSRRAPAARAAATAELLVVLVLDVCGAGVRLERLLHIAVLPIAVKAVSQVPVHRLLEALLPRHLPHLNGTVIF